MEVSTYQRLMCSCSYDGRSNGHDAIEGCNKKYNDEHDAPEEYNPECIDIVDIRDNKKYVFAGCGSHKYFAERTFGQWGGYVSANIYALKQRPRLLTQRVISPCAYRNSNSATLVSSDLRAQISGSISWKHCFFILVSFPCVLPVTVGGVQCTSDVDLKTEWSVTAKKWGTRWRQDCTGDMDCNARPRRVTDGTYLASVIIPDFDENRLFNVSHATVVLLHVLMLMYSGADDAVTYSV